MGIFFEFLVCRLLSCCSNCWIEGRYLVAFEGYDYIEVFRDFHQVWRLNGFGPIEMRHDLLIVRQGYFGYQMRMHDSREIIQPISGFLGQVQVRMLDSGTVIQSISGALPWQRLAPPTSGMCQRRRMLMLRD